MKLIVFYLFLAAALGLGNAQFTHAQSSTSAESPKPNTVAKPDTKAAEDLFKSIYGMELERVTRSPGMTDDLEFAAKLLDATKLATGQQALVSLMLEKVYTLAIRHPKGLDTAIKAMQRLAEVDKTRSAEAHSRLIILAERKFRTSRSSERLQAAYLLLDYLLAAADSHATSGDFTSAAASYRKALPIAIMTKFDRLKELKQAIEYITSRQRSQTTLKMLKMRLTRNSSDTATAEQIMRVYLVEYDLPAKALPFANISANVKAKKLLPHAVSPVAQLSEDISLELADWYRTLAMSAAPQYRAALYTRAKAYYERFTELHHADDSAAARTRLTLLQINNALKNLKGTPNPIAALRGDGNRIFNGRDLTGWKVAHGLSESWTVIDGTLTGRAKVDSDNRKHRGDSAIATLNSYGDAVIRFEYALGVNSWGAIAFRGDPLRNSAKLPFGKQPTRTKSPSNAQYMAFGYFQKPKERPARQWNSVIIETRGNSVKITVNGDVIAAHAVQQRSDSRKRDNRDKKDRPAEKLDKNARRALAYLNKSFKASGVVAFHVFAGEIRFRRITVENLPSKTESKG